MYELNSGKNNGEKRVIVRFCTQPEFQVNVECSVVAPVNNKPLYVQNGIKRFIESENYISLHCVHCVDVGL